MKPSCDEERQNLLVALAALFIAANIVRGIDEPDVVRAIALAENLVRNIP